jgi:MSHA biogenesis protein MshG|tara:strand:- start:412 stop:1644 length:1233 start_codon:yes stop_codon:yes gene_type:complete
VAIYKWRGRNARGEAVESQLEAISEDDVVKQLSAKGVIPLHIAIAAAANDNSTVNWLARLNQKPLVPEDILMFSRQMYTLSKANIPIIRALTGLKASSTKPAMVDMIDNITTNLERGTSLSVAMEKHTDVLGAFYIAMIRTGEMTGRLTEVFFRLNKYIAFQNDVRERIKQATRYPMFVIMAMVLAMVIINIFVIPGFANVYAGFGAELPLVTLALLASSKWVLFWWPWILGFFIGAWLLLRRYISTVPGRYRWDSLKIRLPIIGDIILKATLARFAQSLALSMDSNVPLLQSLAIVGRTTDNAFVGRYIEQMRDGIERGQSITQCAANTEIFTPMVLEMIAVGEETGELVDLLVEIADMYDRETDYSIKGLSAAIEPILVVFMGGLVLVLALGVYLPMWDLSRAVMGEG